LSILPILETRTVSWLDEASGAASCAASARALAQRPDIRRACIELHGTLGAGKTTFVRHLLGALGAQGRVKSPTYALMEPYHLTGFDAWHFDFYRFNDPQEFEDAGFREVFSSAGLKLVEWPEKAAGLLPAADLIVSISFADNDSDNDNDNDQRQVSFSAQTALGLSLLP
jgi:tRNA threonylcarbamoyladenosine biosynthesis protein TsaE